MSLKIEKFKNALTDKELQFIEDGVLGDSFPWFYQKRSIPKNKKFSKQSYPFFSHNLMLRAESKGNNPGIINSEFFDMFFNIFNRNCKSHKHLLRMSLNLTSYNNTEYGDIHVDHDFDHKNMIIYLNKFSNGSTFLFDKNFNKTDEIKSDHNTGCIFPGLLHSQGFCNVGESRLILVATYV